MPAKKEAAKPEKKKSGYDAGSIQVLEGLEAVQKDLECISAPPVPAGYITWFMK